MVAAMSSSTSSSSQPRQPNSRPHGSHGSQQLYRAHHYLRTRDFDRCIGVADEMLRQRPDDQTAWFLKTRAMASKSYVSDFDSDAATAVDSFLEDNAIATARPGTSVNYGRVPTARNLTVPGGKWAGDFSPSVRPVSELGRPVTGYARPGTMSATSGSFTAAEMSRGFTANMRQKTAAARPITGMGGGTMRLNTASLSAQASQQLLDVEKLDLKKFARNSALSRCLFEYIFYHLNNPRKALELAAAAWEHHEQRDWWWAAMQGKCFYRLGLYRDSERLFKAALQLSEMSCTVLDLARVYLKLDQPNSALDQLQQCLKTTTHSSPSFDLLLGTARVYEEMGQFRNAIDIYRQVLSYDAGNIESLSSIATNCFYSQQPEVALVLYRRLLQMGVVTAQVWTNLGMACLYAQQYDLVFDSFHRALDLATDSESADIWYNLSHVALVMGDVGLGKQCLKNCLAVQANHPEALNNLAVLESRKRPSAEYSQPTGAMPAVNNISGGGSGVGLGSQLGVAGENAALRLFTQSQQSGRHLYEPHFNAGLVSLGAGDYAAARDRLQKSLQLHHTHAAGQQWMAAVDALFQQTN